MVKTSINTSEFRSLCPVATGLDILGDKWTLLILRDMIWGHKCLFSEFKESPENMPSKMLSNRLKKLEELGFISKKVGEEKALRSDLERHPKMSWENALALSEMSPL